MIRTQCPKCASFGKDRSQDNLANYPDGSKYCFSCGYWEISIRLPNYNKKVIEPIKSITLPEDITTDIPIEIQQYLKQFFITDKDITKYHIYWSPRNQRICFPIYIDNMIVGWQGRSLIRKPKWFSQGIDDSIIYLTNNKTNTVILVEDIISAINVGKLPLSCCCLFGSIVSLKRIQQLHKMGYDKFILWLDKDKEIESIKRTVELRNLGLICYSLTTDKDPKYYTQDEIKNLLTNYKYCATLT